MDILNVDLFRNETPGCANRIHLNNAGASLMPRQVIEAIQSHISLEGAIGGYEAADLMKKEIDAFYRYAAKIFACKETEIAFTANATDSFNRAISAIPFKEGDVILTTNEDYISNQITYLSFAKRFGTKVVRIKSLPEGGVDLEDLKKCLQKYSPKLLAVTHIPTNSGLVQPINLIGDICEHFDTLYLVDACQSIGQRRLDVSDVKCDFLSVTSRKFLRGPRGAGFLYVSEKALDSGLEPLFIDMRGADWVSENKYVPRKSAIRFEDWEFAYALLLGTRSAIEYFLKIDIIAIKSRIDSLANLLRSGLEEINGVKVCDKGVDKCGIVTFHMDGFDPELIKNKLLQQGINVVTSLRNYAVIDYDTKGVDWTIRVSPHYFNSEDEIETCIKAVRKLKYP